MSAEQVLGTTGVARRPVDAVESQRASRAWWDADADDYLASLPLRSWIVQPSLVYGRDGASARLFRTLASMPFTARFGSREQLVQPIHIDDLVIATVGLLKHRLPMPLDAGTSLRVPLVGPQAMPFTAYLGQLRRNMGMGPQPVVKLPGPLARLAAECGLTPGQAAFVGDDVIDVPALRACGLAVAVADAAPEALLAAHLVTLRPGGRGARDARHPRHHARRA